MRRRRRAALGGATLLAALLGGCGSGSTASPPTSATGAALDGCLVGRWRSISISGSLGDGHGGTIAISGGAGQVLTIGGDGALSVDNSATGPDTGVATDGTAYAITQTGSSTGHVTSTANRLVVSLDHPAALTNTITRNGTTVASGHPGTATDTYTCNAGQSLAITSSGGAVSRFTPAR